MFHIGHLRLLKKAKLHCDYLIVGLQVDPTLDRPEKNKPIQTVVERYIQLKSCKFIDEIVPYATEQDLLDILSSFKINVRIIGEEYKKINWDLAFQKLSKPAGYMIQDQFLILKKSIMQELIFENLVMV